MSPVPPHFAFRVKPEEFVDYRRQYMMEAGEWPAICGPKRDLAVRFDLLIYILFDSPRFGTGVYLYFDFIRFTTFTNLVLSLIRPSFSFSLPNVTPTYPSPYLPVVFTSRHQPSYSPHTLLPHPVLVNVVAHFYFDGWTSFFTDWPQSPVGQFDINQTVANVTAFVRRGSSHLSRSHPHRSTRAVTQLRTFSFPPTVQSPIPIGFGPASLPPFAPSYLGPPQLDLLLSHLPLGPFSPSASSTTLSAMVSTTQRTTIKRTSSTLSWMSKVVL